MPPSRHTPAPAQSSAHAEKTPGLCTSDEQSKPVDPAAQMHVPKEQTP